MVLWIFFFVDCNYSNGCYFVDKQKCQVAKTTQQFMWNSSKLIRFIPHGPMRFINYINFLVHCCKC